MVRHESIMSQTWSVFNFVSRKHHAGAKAKTISTSSLSARLKPETWRCHVSDMERPVNICIDLVWDFVGSSRKAERGAVEAGIATVDQSEIRGLKPQDVDPSGAASDYVRGSDP